MARKLGETLIDAGQINAHQLKEALRTQRIFGGALGTHLLQLGFVEERALGEALATMHQVLAASRRDICQAPPEIVALLSPEFAKRHRALPFRVEGEDLLLALQNPADTLAIHEAAFLTGFNVVAHVAPETVLREALEIYHPSDPPLKHAEAAATGSQTFSSSAAAPADEPTADSPAPPKPPAIIISESLQQAGLRLTRAVSRDEVLEVALDAIDHWCQRSAVFIIRGEEASLLLARRLPLTPGRELGLGLSNSFLFSTLGEKQSQPFFGPVSATPADERFFSLAGGGTPQSIVVVPVYLRGRPVAVLYGDNLKGIERSPERAHLLSLASITAMALEGQILRLKILKTSGNQP